MDTALKHSVQDRVKPSILTSGHTDAHPAERYTATDVKNYKRQLNPVWHRMLYSCTHVATVGVKGINVHVVHKHWTLPKSSLFV